MPMEPSHERNQATVVQKAEHESSHTAHHTAVASAPRVVVVGTETKVFDHASKVRERILAYTEAFASTDIIVMCGGTFAREKVNDRVRIFPTNSFSRWMRLRDAVRLGKQLQHADVVTVQDPFETGLAGLFIARHMGAALHVQVHTDPFAASYAAHSFVNFMRRHVARYVLKRADGIRVVSERVKASIEARTTLKRAISVLPIFVDLERFRSVPVPDELRARFSSFKTRLLVVSRLESEKNVGLAIAAFVRSAPKDVCLIILGNGSERAELEGMAHDAGVMGRIFFEGSGDPAAYYALTDLIVVPSHYEGYGLVIVEALAAGKPVLATDVGIARQAGAIVTDEAHFEAALKQWFTNGPRTGVLAAYPYQSFRQYLAAYTRDIASCMKE